MFWKYLEWFTQTSNPSILHFYCYFDYKCIHFLRLLIMIRLEFNLASIKWDISVASNLGVTKIQEQQLKVSLGQVFLLILNSKLSAIRALLELEQNSKSYTQSPIIRNGPIRLSVEFWGKWKNLRNADHSDFQSLETINIFHLYLISFF